MEISIEVNKSGELKEGENPLLLTCAFTMVALNPITKKCVYGFYGFLIITTGLE